MSNNQYSKYRPHIYKLDSSRIGWRVFPEEPDVIKEYGNIHVKWTVNLPVVNSYRYRPVFLHMSVDSGKTWKQSDGWYGLYKAHFHPHTGWNKEGYKETIPSILASKEKFIRDRARAAAKERREAFKKLPSTQQATILVNKAVSRTERTERLQNQKGKSTSAAMTQLLELGPILVKLRDEIDATLNTMGNGGINKEFPYYSRTCREFRNTQYYIERIQKHIKRCQAKGKGVK